MNETKIRAASVTPALWGVPGHAASLSPEDAARHIGQTATVCGVVASTKFDAHLKSQPTFLDFGEPYPDQVFTAVIFGTDRAKFGTLETALRGRGVCVSGSIRDEHGTPEIILSDLRK